jgi:hypothetical protein
MLEENKMYFQKLSQSKQMIEKQSVHFSIYIVCITFFLYVQRSCYHFYIHIRVFIGFLQPFWNVIHIILEHKLNSNCFCIYVKQVSKGVDE